MIDLLLAWLGGVVLGCTILGWTFFRALRHLLTHVTSCGTCGRGRSRIVIVVPPEGRTEVSGLCEACYGHYTTTPIAQPKWVTPPSE